jgi:hypothetical protein
MLDHDGHVALDRIGIRNPTRQLHPSELTRIIEPHVPCPVSAEHDVDRPERFAILEVEGEAHLGVVRGRVQETRGFVTYGRPGRPLGEVGVRDEPLSFAVADLSLLQPRMRSPVGE